MGRRKIEIKPIKDDRNRSVTFLKRKQGLFKKAHELSVLCNVEVAVIIFGNGNNKKIFDYSSGNIHDIFFRYQHHGGVFEHKYPRDYDGGADDDDDASGPGSPTNSDGPEHPMIPQHLQRHPYGPNGAFMAHPGHPVHRGPSPQPPHMGSRPSSRNDLRRMNQPIGSSAPPQVLNGLPFMPQSAMHQPNGHPRQNGSFSYAQGMQPAGPQFPYPPPQAHTHQMQAYMEEQRRSSLPPSFPPPSHQQVSPSIQRQSVSPPQPPATQLPPQQMHQMSPPPPHHHPMQSPPLPQQHALQQQQLHYQQQQQHEQQRQLQQQHEQRQLEQQPQQQQTQPPQVHIQQPIAPPPDRKPEATTTMRKPPVLDTNFIRRIPQRKGGSIFTPIDENRSILAQHLDAFHPPSNAGKADADGTGSRSNFGSSPPQPSKLNTQIDNRSQEPAPAPENRPTFTVPTRTNSMMTNAGSTSAGSRPRLKVQIPEGASETGGSAAAETSSPRNPPTDTGSQNAKPSGIVLPPFSPGAASKASSIVSPGATLTPVVSFGPPNPYARPPPPPPNRDMKIETPVSALPSRMMDDHHLLPSPSSFFRDWTAGQLPSPLNFNTPTVPNGPSFFFRDEVTPQKRKSPEVDQGNEPKRAKVDA